MLLIFGFAFIAVVHPTLSFSQEDLDISEEEFKSYLEESNRGLPSEQNKPENIFTPYIFDTGVGNREILVVNEITVDHSFPFGRDVIVWHEMKIKDRQYLVGRQERGVSLIRVKIKQFTSEKFNTLIFNETSLQFEGVIGPITLVEHINYASGIKEGFALVTESNEENFQSIHWLKITKKGLVHHDTWMNPTHGEIIDLKWIRLDFTEYLVIVTKENNGHTMIDISEYKMQDNKMRLMCLDKKRIEFKLGSIAAIEEVDNLYLLVAAPPEERIILYRYKLNLPKVGGFEELVNLRSAGVTEVSSFIQSGRTYFLANGGSPNIYLLHRNGTISPQLYNYCGIVEEWLVLKVATYREDVLLLARHQANLAILTWRGTQTGFALTAQPPCFSLDSQMNHINKVSEDGRCLTSCNWSGGVSLDLGHVPSLLLTCDSGGIYHLKTSLHPVDGPSQDVQRLLTRSQLLQGRVKELSEEFERQGLLEGVLVSRDRLDEGRSPGLEELEVCVEEVEKQTNLLSSYLELRSQNDVQVDMSFRQGKLTGSASGLLANQPLTATFTGKLGWASGNRKDRVIDVESTVVSNGDQQFNVKATVILNSAEVTESDPVEDIRSSSTAGFGVSPEVHGPPNSHDHHKDELLLHERIAHHMYN